MSNNSFKTNILNIENSTFDQYTKKASTVFSDNFESGSFANWNVVNGTQFNKWYVLGGYSYFGTYSAGISFDGDLNTFASDQSVVFFYKDILIPSNSILTFKYKANYIDAYNNLSIINAPTSQTVSEGVIISTVSGGTIDYLQNNEDTYASAVIDLTSYANQTRRIIFQWQNDGTISGTPGANIDNIEINTYTFNAGDIINKNNVIQYYNGTNFVTIEPPSVINNTVDVVLRNQFDFSGNSYVEAIPQFPWTTPVKLPDPATLPTNLVTGCSWSCNNEFLALVHNVTPFITIYQRSGTTFTKLANPAALPAGDSQGGCFSPNGEFLAIAHTTTPFVTIYQRSGTTFTKLANPAILPTGNGQNVSWSPNGEFLTVTHLTTPFITIYQRSGTTFTKLANPATLPTGIARKSCWSPNAEFLAISHDVSPFLTIYQRSGTTFTKLANPATLPVGTTGRGICFSPDGQFLAIGHDSSPFITIYQRSGTTFTKLADPASLPPGLAQGISFSANGKLLGISHSVSPFVTIYQRSETTFTKLADPATLPTGTGYANAWSFNGEFLTFGHITTPFVTIYQTSSDIPDNSVLKIINPKLGQS